jgi:hypothetical protein
MAWLKMQQAFFFKRAETQASTTEVILNFFLAVVSS